MHQKRGLQVGDFADRAKNTSLDEFCARYRHPFLIVVGLEYDEGASDYFTTTRPFLGMEELQAITEGKKLDPTSLVFPVKKRYEANPYADLITIGRAENCDIVLPFQGVSKFHIYFRTDWDTPESIVLGDGGSRNGTALNGTVLEAKKTATISNGDRIELGSSVMLRYFTARGFWELLKD